MRGVILMSDTPAIDRRRMKMRSVRTEINSILTTAIEQGTEFVHTARFRSLLLHFEADRIRIEAMLRGHEPMAPQAAVLELIERENGSGI